jgi:hypothetical protein
MARTLTFFHTSPVHIQTFQGLLTELAPDIPARHVVDESLLSEARARGTVTPELRARAEDEFLSAARDQEAALLVCTCSSIGAVAEALNERQHHTPMMRIDRAMAEEAVALGPRVIVAATLPTTLIPTRELILSIARSTAREIQVIELLCDTAWRQFELGNQEAYLREVAATSPRAGVLAAIAAYRSL